MKMKTRKKCIYAKNAFRKYMYLFYHISLMFFHEEHLNFGVHRIVHKLVA
jgi:hypothetical protein